jgi:sulfate adenylyltransferase subunit 2
MDALSELENRTIFILREAYQRFKKTALLWSAGKDSTALLWMCRKAFFGKIPFPVIHIDTSYKFKEIYAFRDKWAKEWGLDLLVSRNDAALKDGMNNQRGVLNCCGALKTQALKDVIGQNRLNALYLAIRRDEHGIRSKERYFSFRDESSAWDYWKQSPELWGQFNTGAQAGEHYRVHPLLDWTEQDIWNYTLREKIPVIGLYFAKKGQRYRSIGCAPCCAPVPSRADNIQKVIRELKTTRTAERSGRAQDKEAGYTMQKLRSLGYM